MDTKQIIEEAHAVIGLAKSLIERLEAELAEAEKPQLRHWDFGYDEDSGDEFIVIEQSGLFGSPKAFYADQKGQVHVNESTGVRVRLGNLKEVFDRRKAIAEPLDKFATDVHSYAIDSDNFPDAPIRMAGNHHSVPEVEEHILKLRRLVYTAKGQKHGD